MAGTDRPRVKRILYFADSMCSWCWGFSPVIGEIARACGDRVPIRLCVGGLRAGETRAMDDRARAFVRHQRRLGSQRAHGHGGAASGLGVVDEGFSREERIRERLSGARLHLFPVVDFYAENRDVTREDVLAEVAAALGLARDDFIAVYRAPEVVEATRADFALTQALGIAGFPTLLLQNEQLAILSAGYRPYAELEPDLRAWLGE